MTYFDFETIDLNIHVQCRPPYCDRGRWTVIPSVKPERLAFFTLDHADMFPRMYFTKAALLTELEAFLIVRKQWADGCLDELSEWLLDVDLRFYRIRARWESEHEKQSGPVGSDTPGPG